MNKIEELLKLAEEATPGDVRDLVAKLEVQRNMIHGIYKSMPDEWHDWALEMVADLNSLLCLVRKVTGE